jgi:tRNA A37 threonylcarbamoyladenosine dehydratase
MPDQFLRTRMLLGDAAVERLHRAKVLLFGVGGVGGGAAEALARAGVGHIELVDNDAVSETNLNRQMVALHSTVGRLKTAVMAERIKDINPNAAIVTHDVFYTVQTAELFDFTRYDYVLDAIDTVSAKLIIADLCYKGGVKLISSMGTGNRLDPTKLTVGDIYKTAGDPLARVMRRELKRIGVPKLKVVYSLEEPRKPLMETDEKTVKRSVPASIAFVPPVAGMIMAGEAVRDLIGDLL